MGLLQDAEDTEKETFMRKTQNFDSINISAGLIIQFFNRCWLYKIPFY